MWKNFRVIPQPQMPSYYIEWLVRLLAFIGGVVSTVVGSWISSKIRVYHDNRKAHRDELKEKVLGPLGSCLDETFVPLVTLVQPAVATRWNESSFTTRAPSTEPQTRSQLTLEAVNPWLEFKAAVDRVLYEDARKKHFAELLTRAEEFASAWKEYAEHVCQWVQEMSQQLSRTSGLPPWQPGPGVWSCTPITDI
jgi:hypothetical protein